MRRDEPNSHDVTAPSRSRAAKASTGQESRRGRRPMDKLLVTVEEAADALGIGRSLMFELIGSGEVQSLKLGRRRLVPVTALRDWLATRLATPQLQTP